MEIILPNSGTYIIAVSGGVDSMALLNMLTSLQKERFNRYDFIIGHVNHGIRDDAYLDKRLVEEVARKRKLPFYYHEAQLGARASEATAREARYTFLHNLRKTTGAQAIITAHHQDDVLETAILNMLRGTHRRGLTALGTQLHILRPLLHTNKASLLTYAQEHKLLWREDSTNQDDNYLRNYVRRHILNKLTINDRQKLLRIIDAMHNTNDQLDTVLQKQLANITTQGALLRESYDVLPYTIAVELLASWLRNQGVTNYDKKTLLRLAVQLKTLPPGKRVDVLEGRYITITKKNLTLQHDIR